MNFSGIGAQTLLGRILRFPLRFFPNETIIPIFQGRLRGKKWIVGSSIHGCWLGSYEYGKRKIFEKTIMSDTVVFDIGAHVGFYTLLAATLVGSRGKVFAFEPFPRNLDYLNRHLLLNGVKNVTVMPVAVSDQSGVALFQEGVSNSMGQLADEGNVSVVTVNIDKMVFLEKLPVPDYIKIDVEGAEYNVLKGAYKVLAKKHPLIFLATHGKAQQLACCELLKSLNYNLIPIGGTSLDQVDEILAS